MRQLTTAPSTRNENHEEDILRNAARQIGPRATAMPCDVSKLDELSPLVERVEREVGPLSVVVDGGVSIGF